MTILLSTTAHTNHWFTNAHIMLLMLIFGVLLAAFKTPGIIRAINKSVREGKDYTDGGTREREEYP